MAPTPYRSMQPPPGPVGGRARVRARNFSTARDTVARSFPAVAAAAVCSLAAGAASRPSAALRPAQPRGRLQPRGRRSLAAVCSSAALRPAQPRGRLQPRGRRSLAAVHWQRSSARPRTQHPASEVTSHEGTCRVSGATSLPVKQPCGRRGLPAAAALRPSKPNCSRGSWPVIRSGPVGPGRASLRPLTSPRTGSSPRAPGTLRIASRCSRRNPCTAHRCPHQLRVRCTGLRTALCRSQCT